MWHGIYLVKICCFLNHYLSFHILVLGYREEKPTEDSPHAHKCNRTLQEHHINPQSRFRSVDWNRRRLQAKKFQYSFFSWRKCGTTIAPLVFHNCFLVCIYREEGWQGACSTNLVLLGQGTEQRKVKSAFWKQTRHGLDGRSLKQGEEGAISLLFLLLPLNSAGGGGYHPLAICPILKQ